ncbi:MAG: hypothetical protein JWO13_2282 [Acidobacteriales bacterium]|nr:hypothetical protein [Terriglobales bacterium]
MPRTALAIQQITRNNGAQLVSVVPDAANGNNYVNDGRTELIVHNGDAAPHSVTIKSVPAGDYGRSGDIVVAVAAGERAALGPFDKVGFNQADGTVNVDWTSSVSMKVATRQF